MNPIRASNSSAVPVRATLWLLAATAVLCAGCTARIGGSEQRVDLRERNLKLKRQVDQLERRIELQQGQIENLRSQLEGERDPMPDAKPPVLSKVQFARFSGALDTDGDQSDDVVRLYVHTLDQMGRMLPVAGRAVLQVAMIEPDKQPQLLVEKQYSPAEWDQAYRSTITGVHYTVDAKLPESLPQGELDATVKLTFTQAGTGAKFTAQKPLVIRR